MDALVFAAAGRDGTLATDGQHEWSVLHSHPHRGQTRPLLAESVQWWVHVDILSEQDAVFQMSLPQLLRCRRQSLRLFLHNLAHSEADMALVMVLVVAVALADGDVVDADVDAVDVDVADADEADADEADAV